jgi:hypothetical protein
VEPRVNPIFPQIAAPGPGRTEIRRRGGHTCKDSPAHLQHRTGFIPCPQSSRYAGSPRARRLPSGRSSPKMGPAERRGHGMLTDGRPGRLPCEEERRGTPDGVRNPAGTAARLVPPPAFPPGSRAFRDHVTTEKDPASGMFSRHPCDIRRCRPDAGRAIAGRPFSVAGSALPFHPPAEDGRTPRAVARTRDVRAAGPTLRSQKVFQWPTRCSSMPPTRRRRAS